MSQLAAHMWWHETMQIRHTSYTNSFPAGFSKLSNVYSITDWCRCYLFPIKFHNKLFSPLPSPLFDDYRVPFFLRRYLSSPKIYFPQEEVLEWRDWTHRCSSFGYLKLYSILELWRIPSKPLFSQCGKGLNNFTCDGFFQEIYIHLWHVWEMSPQPFQYEMLRCCCIS